MDDERIVFADDAPRVIDRDGTQYCVFETRSGKEVLYFRNDKDRVTRCFDGRLNSLDDVRCRGIAAKCLTDKIVLVHGSQHTTKKFVPPKGPQQPKTKSVAVTAGWRPSRLDDWCAKRHDGQINPHQPDD